MKNKKFFFDQIRGITFDGNIIKFNLVNHSTSESSDDAESLTIITNYERFKGMVDFLNQEHEKIQDFVNSKHSPKKNEKPDSSVEVKLSKKILTSHEDH